MQNNNNNNNNSNNNSNIFSKSKNLRVENSEKNIAYNNFQKNNSQNFSNAPTKICGVDLEKFSPEHQKIIIDAHNKRFGFSEKSEKEIMREKISENNLSENIKPATKKVAEFVDGKIIWKEVEKTSTPKIKKIKVDGKKVIVASEKEDHLLINDGELKLIEKPAEKKLVRSIRRNVNGSLKHFIPCGKKSIEINFDEVDKDKIKNKFFESSDWTDK
jgi:hypothetical protein